MTSEVKGHLAMLCFSAFIAGSFALGSMISNNLSPLIVTVIRFMITALFLGGLIYFTQTIKKIYFISPWRYLFLGLCVTLYFVLMFEALKTSSAISLSVEFTMAPFISGLFGYFLLGQKINLRIFIALVIGAIGAIWVIFNGEALSRYIDKKMDLARSHPYGSKVWASEIIQGAPIIQDYLEGQLKEWSKDRSKHIQR
ncbi:TetR family transcriptional regulator C-terminal domain-containing protein, partial [Amylibacter sp.]|nr:TetR family transcriptional regulator C-terminal domain-containing protein [Amylibacter sp.]